MITDILGSGVTGGTDAVSSSKTPASGRSADDRNGFSEALSGFDREASQRSDDAQDEHEEHASSAQDRMAGGSSSTRSRPVIDIRPESLRRQNLDANGTEALKAKAKANVKSDETGSVKHQGDADERELTPAEKKLQEALAAAKAVARKSDEQHEKRTAAAGKDVTKKAETDETAGEADKSMLGADDAKIVDMLTLLHGGEANAATLHAASQKTAAPVQGQGKRSKDGDERVEEAGVAGTGEGKRVGLGGHAGGEGAEATVAADTAVPGTKQFRFTNARGDSQSMDVTAGRERNTVEMRQSSGNGGENVTVLDSRRYLGLAPNSNGSNLTALMSGDSEWAAAMQPSSSLSNAATQSSTGQVVNTLKLQMNPFDLGQVTATLRLHGDELNVHLTVETRAAYKQLSEDSSGMLDALRAQGFNVDQVTISIAPTADSDASNNQQPQGQQAGQMSQQMAEGGRQGHATGRGQDQASGERAGTMNDAVSDGTPVSGSGSARSGQLYL